MSYCTQSDILELIAERVLIGLTDDDDIGVVDDGKVDRAIASADAMIDSYCQGRYDLPLSPVPARILEIAVDLAIYNLYSRTEQDPPEIRKDRKADAMRYLELVRKGEISLGASTPTPQTSGNEVQVSSSDRIFTRDTLEGF
jgi:phage gp36-like protein